MCGIIGCLTTQLQVLKYLKYGIKALQNRGYDSVGLCYLENDNNNNNVLKLHKSITENQINAVDSLELELNDIEIKSNIGIAHTRWATHGKVNKINCHPHQSNDKNITLVHNGIIENYLELKEFLTNYGYTFYSDTDTEIIVNLLQYLTTKYNNNDMLYCIKKLNEYLSGTWGLVIYYDKQPNRLYFTRQGSPLLLGMDKNNKIGILTSEKSGFNKDITEFIDIPELDMAYIEHKNNQILYYSFQLDTTIKRSISGNLTDELNDYLNLDEISNLFHHKLLKKRQNNIDLDYELGKYPHWTLKEIEEQEKSYLRAINYGGRILNNNQVKLGGLEDYQHIIKEVDNLILLGCGTSYHSCLLVSYLFHDICDLNTIQVIDGADFEKKYIPKLGTTIAIFVSQSGETTDLLRGIDICKSNNILTIGVVNVVGSQLSKLTDCGVYLNAGKEVGVASTKAFTSQSIVLSLIGVYISQLKNIYHQEREEIISDLKKYQTDLSIILNQSKIESKHLADKIDRNSLFVLGKEEGYAIASEGSLKIKEISYLHCESYPSSSLKHGPFGLLEKDFPVILIDIGEKHRKKKLNVYQEISCRGANVITITDDNNMNRDNTIIIPQNNTFGYLLSIIPLQYLSYYLSIKKNINPDYPRNLAKVVTVE